MCINSICGCCCHVVLNILELIHNKQHHKCFGQFLWKTSEMPSAFIRCVLDIQHAVTSSFSKTKINAATTNSIFVKVRLSRSLFLNKMFTYTMKSLQCKQGVHKVMVTLFLLLIKLWWCIYIYISCTIYSKYNN